MAQEKQQKKPHGRSREEMLKISEKTRWKPGQSGNPNGRPSLLSEKAVSDGLRAFYNDSPKEFKKFILSAHHRATGKRASAKFWELISERLEGKVASHIDIRAEILHSITEQDVKQAEKTIEMIRSFESEIVPSFIAEKAVVPRTNDEA